MISARPTVETLRLYGDEDGLDGGGYPDIGDRNPYDASNTEDDGAPFCTSL
jgi:hypothetical protein